MKLFLRAFLLLGAFTFSQLSFAGLLEDAWKSFDNNERSASKSLFKKALSSPTDKAEAYLGLALIDYKEGNDVGACQNFISFYNLSEYPYPYLYALWSSGVLAGFQQKLTEENAAFLNKVLKDPKANGTIKAMIYQQMGYDAFAKNRMDDYRPNFSAIKSIDKWQLVGVFDNVSGSGFDKDYPPVSQPSNTAVFEDKVKAKVKWFTLPQSRNDKWVDMSYSFDFSNSIIFGQTFVKSAEEQDVYLRVGVSGSFKIWINDALVAAESEERNTDMDVYSYKTHLSKGYNRILIQIGESEIDKSNFLVRITDENANPLEGLTISAEPQPYIKQGTIKSEAIPLFAETFFEKKIQQQPDKILNYYLLAETYLRNDKVHEAKEVLFKARALAPNSEYVCRKLMESYSREGNTTDHSKEWENIKKIDPDNILSITSLISEAEKKENYDEMERLVNKMEKLYGRDERIIAYKIQIAGQREKSEEIVRLAEEGYKKYPDVLGFVDSKALIEREINQNLKGAIGIYEKYLKNNYSEDAKMSLSSLYFKNGSPDKGVKQYEGMLKEKPYAIGYIDDLVKYFTDVKFYDKAISYSNQALQYAPYVGALWANLGKVYNSMDDDDKAIEYLKKASGYSPNDYDVKKLLRKLQNKKDLYEYFQEINITEVVNQKPTVTLKEDDNSVILLHEVQKIIYSEGGSEEKEYVIAKILTKSGVDDWKEYQIDYNRYSQRLIIEESKITKANGNKIEAERNGSHLVFTGLEVGDVITVVYRLENYTYGKLANEFWEKHNLNGFYPRQHVKVSYIIPKNRKFDFKILNAEIEPVKSNIDAEYVKYVWEQKEQPAMKSERYMPTTADVGKILHISSIPDWNTVASIYADMSTAKAKVDLEVKEVVANIFKGKGNLSETAKAKAIYEWILDNIHYSYVPFRQSGLVPQKAATTINTRLGDCKDVSTLFVAMAKEAGLKAHLVLVDTRDNGDKDLQLPSLDFNHCIAKVKADGKDYYLELTFPQLSFAAQPYKNIGALILDIPNDGTTGSNKLSVLQHPNMVENNVRRETEVSFENNDIIIKRKNIHFGAYAANRRDEHQEKSIEEREKDVQTSLTKAFNKPVKLTATEWSDLKELTDSTVITYYYTIKGGMTEFGGMKLFEIPWTDAESTPSFLSTEKRDYNINFWEYDYADNMLEIMKFKIPQGKTLVEVPKSQTYKFKNMTYHVDYKVSGNELIAQRKVLYTGDRIIQNTDYEEFREFFNKIIQEDHRQIGFK